VTVSVVIPVRDGATYLAAAIDSVVAQTVAPAEILIVDDGSTDGSVGIAERSGARVLSQGREGAGAARNRGVRAARGSLVAFLDADDVMEPGRLAAQSRHLARHPEEAGALGNVGRLLEEGGRWFAARVPAEPGLVPSTLTIRRDVFLETGGFCPDLVAGEFIDWMGRARRSGLVFAVLDEVVALRRTHSANTTRDRARLRQGYLDVARRAITRQRIHGE
jgi:glycosyltransferase involved in cell wall biosynthesis